MTMPNPALMGLRFHLLHNLAKNPKEPRNPLPSLAPLPSPSLITARMNKLYYSLDVDYVDSIE